MVKGFDPVTNPFFIHFEYEGWKPRLLTMHKEAKLQRVQKEVEEMYVDEKGYKRFRKYLVDDIPIEFTQTYFYIKRMIPAGWVRYFFSMPYLKQPIIAKMSVRSNPTKRLKYKLFVVNPFLS